LNDVRRHAPEHCRNFFAHLLRHCYPGFFAKNQPVPNKKICTLYPITGDLFGWLALAALVIWMMVRIQYSAASAS
jgi:hypothetical protein